MEQFHLLPCAKVAWWRDLSLTSLEARRPWSNLWRCYNTTVETWGHEDHENSRFAQISDTVLTVRWQVEEDAETFIHLPCRRQQEAAKKGQGGCGWGFGKGERKKTWLGLNSKCRKEKNVGSQTKRKKYNKRNSEIFAVFISCRGLS